MEPLCDHFAQTSTARLGLTEQLDSATSCNALKPLSALRTGVLEVDRAINDAIYGEGCSAADVLDGKVRTACLTDVRLGVGFSSKVRARRFSTNQDSPCCLP